MHGCGVESLHVVERDGWVNHKAEQSGTHHIPKSDGDEEVYGPTIFLHPFGRLRVPDVFPRFESHQHEGHNFKRTENGTKGENGGRRPRKIEMMEGPDDSS